MPSEIQKREAMYIRFGGLMSRIVIGILLLAGYAVLSRGQERREARGTHVSTGQRITPDAAPGTQVLRLHTDFRYDDNGDGGNAVSTALSTDGKTLLILTSGFNYGFSRDDGTPIEYSVLDPVSGQPTGSTTSAAEWVFVDDVTGPTSQVVLELRC
jgi:hypothetical protein